MEHLNSYSRFERSSDDDDVYEQKLDLVHYSGLDEDDDYLYKEPNENNTVIEKASSTSRLKEVATLFTRCATGAKAVLQLGSEAGRVAADQNVKMASKVACFLAVL